MGEVKEEASEGTLLDRRGGIEKMLVGGEGVVTWVGVGTWCEELLRIWFDGPILNLISDCLRCSEGTRGARNGLDRVDVGVGREDTLSSASVSVSNLNQPRS